MSRSLTSGMKTELSAAALSPALFVEVDTAGGNVYAWSGLGEITWNGQTWQGVGEFGGVSPIPEVTQVQAAGVELTLSGIPSALISTALQDVRRFKPVKIWLACLDASLNIIADPYLALSGRCDTAKLTADGTTGTIVITVESRLVDLKRSRERRYTDQDQQIDFPGDKGFSSVANIQDAVITWGAPQ